MKKIIFFLVTFLLSLSTLSWAYEYVLEKGKGCEVCEAYEKNLNSLKNNPIYRRINPELKDFSTPKWEDIWTSSWITRVPRDVNLSLEISDFFWKRDVNPAKYFRGDLSNWQGTKKQLSGPCRQ